MTREEKNTKLSLVELSHINSHRMYLLNIESKNKGSYLSVGNYAGEAFDAKKKKRK